MGVAGNAGNEEYWRRVLTEGPGTPKRMRHMLARLPRNPRCKICYSPFRGFGGFLTRMMGHGPSRKNPNLCRHCYERQPPGGAEVDIAVLFADVRGSTAMGERLGAGEFAATLNRFYEVSTDVLLRHDAVIDKMVGDEVMALFIPGFCGPDYRKRAAEAADMLIRRLEIVLGEGARPPVGAGVHAGVAYVGNVGGGDIVDFTALGDTVNTAARLQGIAEPGTVVLSEELYRSVADSYPQSEARTAELKGKEAPFPVRVIVPSAESSDA